MVKTSTILLVITILFFGIIMMSILGFIGLVFSGDPVENGNVAIIPVYGVIISGDSSSFLGESYASSTQIIELIKKANNNPEIKAIILEINSPGGSAVASDEIGQALKDVNKTKVAWIREIGTSGGYWIASNCDQIIANRMSITGSIGVISSYLDYSGLIDNYNVSYQRLVSGQYKDIGSPFRKLKTEEEEILQLQLNKVHEFFIQEISTNRNLPYEKTKELSTGLFFLGVEAKDFGLIDELGGEKEVIEYLENKLETTIETVNYYKEPSFFEILMGTFYEGSFNTGRGFAHELKKSDKDFSVLKLI
jgi:protease IV